MAELLEAHAAALAEAEEKLRRIGLAPSVRVKTRSTLIDKVRRGTRLSTMDDLAGARIVADVTWSEQDRIVHRISGALPDGKLVDRRENPSHGYRAVHYVASVGDCRVEIQIRTVLQDLWAQVVETLGDRWGRGIRYGEQPPEPDRDAGAGLTRQGVLDRLLAGSESAASLESVIDVWTEARRLQSRIRHEPLRRLFEGLVLGFDAHRESLSIANEQLRTDFRKLAQDVQ